MAASGSRSFAAMTPTVFISSGMRILYEFINTQFFFPTQNVRMLLSDAELSIGTSSVLQKYFQICFLIYAVL